MRKQYPLLDLGKFIASLLIVYIHVPLFLSLDAAVNYWVMLVTRIAVPFFFIVSSFLYFEQYKAREDRNGYRKKWCRNLLKTWIWWSAFYFVLRMIEIVFYGFDFVWHCKLIVRDFLFDGISGHLWYVPALLFSVLFVQFLLKHFGKLPSWILACLLFVLGTVCNTYIVFMPEKLALLINKILYIIKYTRNGLFWAPILILCGYELHQSYNKVMKFSDKGYALLLVSSAALMFVEGTMIAKFSGSYGTYAQDMWVSCIPAAAILAALLIKKSVGAKTNYTFFRRISQYVYFVHPAYIYMFKMLLYNRVSLEEASGWYFIAVLIMTLGTAVVLMKLDMRRKKRVFVKREIK